MAESTIITGQFVRISQTPASIGERLLALVIDYSLIVIYLYSVTTLIVKLHLSSGAYQLSLSALWSETFA